MTSILFLKLKIYCEELKYNYLKNKKFFLDFLLHFWNLHQIWNILKNKMSLIADVFPKLDTAKNMLTQMSKKTRFRTPFHRQHVKASPTPLEPAQQQLYPIVSSLWENLDRTKSHLVISEILGLFVNTLFADDQYFLHIRKNLPQPIQLQLSKKAKYFLKFLLQFLNVHQILKAFFFLKKTWAS